MLTECDRERAGVQHGSRVPAGKIVACQCMCFQTLWVRNSISCLSGGERCKEGIEGRIAAYWRLGRGCWFNRSIVAIDPRSGGQFHDAGSNNAREPLFLINVRNKGD